MTREDIKKAAAEYAHGACRPLWRAGKEQVCMVDFIEGAKWRINSVWHEGSEKPETDKGDLFVEIEVMDKTTYVQQNAYYVLRYGCVRWAYIKDLISNKE